MKIVILPCIGTSWAIAEPEDGLLPIEIRSPRKLSNGETELILWRFYQDLCRYDWELDRFKHLAYLAPFWCAASAICAYLRWYNLWTINPVFMVTYGWTTVWLVCDGLWLAVQCLNKFPQWWRARRALKTLGEHWTVKVVIDGRLATLASERDLWLGKEHDWVEHMAGGATPLYMGLYARLLKRYPPRAMDFWPVGIWRYLARMMWGVKVRRPWMCWPIEK